MAIPKLSDIIMIGQLQTWKKRLEKERKSHKLRYLFWETTRSCNLNCRHCGSDCGSPYENELTCDEIKAVFKTIAEDYKAKDIMVAVTGGEPLLRKDIFDVMGYASSLGFRWGIVTNGMLVDEEIADKCFNAGMKTVTVSVDGMKKSHDHIRKFDGSFDRAINALKIFKKNKFEIVQATTCVSRYNLDDLPGLYSLFKEIGIDEWRLLTVNPIGRAKQDEMFTLKPLQFRYMLDFIKDCRKNKGLRVVFEEEGFLGVEYEGKVRDSLYYCPAGINIASVLADGSIGACPNLPREFIQGNVREDRFSHIWETRFKNMRDLSWKKKGICSECIWWDFCLGNSLHLWDLAGQKPVVCHMRLLGNDEKA
jgi:radical SAM protein with 4Fe4S-binding SPASM domain